MEPRFSDGAMDAHWLGPEAEVDSTRVRVYGDLLRFEWPDGEWFAVSTSLEGNALRFRELHGFGSDLGLIGFAGGPWEKVG